MLFLKTRIRRIKFWAHLAVAYLQRYRGRTLVLLLTIGLFIVSIFRIWPLLARNNILTIGYVGAYTLDTIPSSVFSLVTDPLISTNAEGKPQGALASNWTVSEDGKTYVVFLKDNLKWHDQSQVNAKDISIAINNVQITALNNKAIEFKLPNPISSFPQALDKPVFKARSFYGTGEYRIVDIDQVDNVVKKISLHPGNKDLPRVDIKFYENEETLSRAIKMGEVKKASVSGASSFAGWPNLSVEKKESSTEILTIFYNNNDPIFSSKDMRQALSYAINRANLDGREAYSPISYASWAYNSQIKHYEYNSAKAKELLAKSEIKDASVVLSYTGDFEKVAQVVAGDWRALGVNVELKKEEAVPKTFQALLAINKLGADPDQYPLWHSTQTTTNITFYKNAKIDKLLEDGRSLQQEEKRREAYLDFQKFLMDDAPVTFLYYPYVYDIRYKNSQPLISKLPKN